MMKYAFLLLVTLLLGCHSQLTPRVAARSTVLAMAWTVQYAAKMCETHADQIAHETDDYDRAIAFGEICLDHARVAAKSVNIAAHTVDAWKENSSIACTSRDLVVQVIAITQLLKEEGVAVPSELEDGLAVAQFSAMGCK